jgi:hypothetical protein
MFLQKQFILSIFFETWIAAIIKIERIFYFCHRGVDFAFGYDAIHV